MANLNFVNRFKTTFIYRSRKIRKVFILSLNKSIESINSSLIISKSSSWIKNSAIPYLDNRSEVLFARSSKAFDKSSKWIQHIAIPTIHKRTELIVDKLTKEDGSEFWTALSQSKKWSSKIIWTLVGISSFGIVWATFSKIDETVQAQGKLEPVGTTIDVKVPMGGVIKEILVKEGQLVNENQILLQLDTTAVSSKLNALKIVKSQINADILLARQQLGEEIDIDGLNQNQRLKMDSLSEEYKSRINASISAVRQSKLQKDSLLQQIKTLEEVIPIREEILERIKPLSEEGAISKVQYLKELQEVLQLRGRLLSQQSELKRYEELLLESEDRLKNTIAASNIDFSTKIEENQKQLAQLDNQISEAELTLSYQEIKSPLRGLVFDLQVFAPGYVVDSNRPILKIVPSDDLVARIFISNRDIAFLKKGQPVKLRLDPYPYNEFGEISGKIKSIGSDVLEPDEKYNFFRFPVTVSIDEPFIMKNNKRLPLRTGMSLTANIVLRQRPVISLFTEKILPFWDGLEQM